MSRKWIAFMLCIKRSNHIDVIKSPEERTMEWRENLCYFDGLNWCPYTDNVCVTEREWEREMYKVGCNYGSWDMICVTVVALKNLPYTNFSHGFSSGFSDSLMCSRYKAWNKTHHTTTNVYLHPGTEISEWQVPWIMSFRESPISISAHLSYIM